MVERGQPNIEALHTPKPPDSFEQWVRFATMDMVSNPDPFRMMHAARFARQYLSTVGKTSLELPPIKRRMRHITDYRGIKRNSQTLTHEPSGKRCRQYPEAKNDPTPEEAQLMLQIQRDLALSGTPIDQLKLLADKLMDSAETAQPLIKEKEPTLDHEHVMYGNYTVIPDTHSVDPAIYGVSEDSENIICMGDVLDRKSDRVNTHRRDAKKAIETWTKLLETNRAQMILGNHELYMLSGVVGKNMNDFLMWMNNGGDWTLSQLGIDCKDFLTETEHRRTKRYQFTDDNKYTTLLTKIQENGTLMNFANQLVEKGKLYLIVNEVMLQHAGIPLSTEGELISPRYRRVFIPGYEGKRGLDAFDEFENKIRSKDADVLHILATASYEDRSPSTVRRPFYQTMANPTSAQRANEQLAIQAWNRGAGGCHLVIVGHEISIGGKEIGPYLKGADTGRCNPMKFSISGDGRNATVASSHNFGHSEPIMYQLKKPMEPTQPSPSPSGIR